MRRGIHLAIVTTCVGILILGMGCKSKKDKEDFAITADSTLGDINVAYVSPKGQTQTLHETESVVVIFDRPMIPLKRLGDDRGSDLIEFTPAVRGKFRWLNPKTMTFTPEKRFPYATEIQAVIPKGAKSFEGYELSDDYRWTFLTVQPKLEQHFPENKQKWVDLDSQVLLIFNIPILKNKARDFIAFTAISSKKIESELAFDIKNPSKNMLQENNIQSSPDNVLWLKPKQQLKPDHRYFVQIKAGLLASEGDLGMAKNRIFEFKTYKKFSFVEFKAGQPHNPQAEFEFNFTNPVIYSDFVKSISLTPSVAIPEYYQEWTHTNTKLWLSLPLEPESEYTLTIDPNLKDRFGNELGKEVELEFKTSPHPPEIDMTTGFGILESYGDRRYPVYAVNSKDVVVQVAHIRKNDVRTILNTKQLFWQKNPVVLKNMNWVEKTIPLNRKRNIREVFPVELKDLLPKAGGVVLLQLDTKAKDEWNRYLKALLQVTNLGISAKYSADNNLIWVTSLKEGKPVAGAEVEIYGDDNKVRWRGKTDEEGKVKSPGWKPLGIKSRDKWSKPRQWVFVQKDEDFAFISSDWGTGVSPYQLGIPFDWDSKPESRRGYIFTERGIYRAGETVHIKGQFREKAESKWQIPKSVDIQCNIYDPFNKIVFSENLKLDEYGSFDLDFETNQDAALGNYQIAASQQLSKEKEKAKKTFGSFRVEAFRPAEFELHLRSLEDSYTFSDDYEAELRASYLFGGAMGFQKINWALRLNPTFYSPPKHKDYTFGNQAEYRSFSSQQDSRLIHSGTETLSEEGIFRLKTKLIPDTVTDSVLAALEATVQGPSRRSVTNRIQTLVHRGEFYIGLKPESRFLTKGDELKVNVLAVKPDGEVASNQGIELTLSKREWHSVRKAGMGSRYSWISEQKDKEIERRKIKSESEPVIESFLPENTGYYILKAKGRDEKKNQISTSLYFYVTGKDYVPWGREDDDTIELVADRKTYHPGQVARVMVKSPYERAQALVTLEREGVLESWVQEVEGSTSTIDVPIRSEHLPNVYVCVLLMQGRTSKGSADREQDLGRPSFKIGYANLIVDPGEKKLGIAIQKDKEVYKPGDEVIIKFKVKDADAKGTASSISVAVVDIGVLNLIGYRTPDPFSVFYSQLPLSVETSESRYFVLGQRVYGDKGDEPGGGVAEMARLAAPLSLSEVELRGDFKYTAYWNPSVLTDENGNAELQFTLPDNLTTFRVMAVAQTKNSKFGRSEEHFRVAKPLLLQPSLPRFARVGDAFKGGVVVHNHSNKAGDLLLECNTEGIVLDDKKVIRQFKLEPGEGREVLFAFKAAATGTATFSFRAKMDGNSDGLELKIPIILPRPTETVALYNDTHDSIEEQIKIPENIFPDLSRLSLRASASALSSLKGNVEFLKNYPYLCLEQRISSLLPFLVAGDIILDFKLTESTKKEIKSFVSQTLKAIYSYQKGSGGFGLWPDSQQISPFNTCYAAFALYQAQKVGYSIDERVVSQLLNYLRNLARGKKKQSGYPYGSQTWKTIEAYALYTLALFNRAEPSYAEKMYTERESLSLFGKTLLLKALYHGKGSSDAQTTLLQELQNKLKVAPTTAHFEEDTGNEGRWIYSSNLRSTAFILQTLLEVGSENPLLSAITHWLVERRKAGKWLTTQDNFYVFYALNEYYREYEKIPPDFKLQVHLAGKAILDEVFRQRTGEAREAEIALSDFTPGETLGLDITKKGKGRFYYETRLTYAPKTSLGARDEGFTVYKTISDFEGKPLESIQAGDLVVVTLQVITPQERLYVVLKDPLPAGLEAVNPNFAIESREQQRRLSELSDQTRWWWRGFNHIEIHDNRVLLFADSLLPGIHTHRYLARALTFGTFLTPGTKIEEMYSPEVFGRSGEMVIHIQK
ncbi:MG2 domain-containing protein [Acidobacteriota bacterium]